MRLIAFVRTTAWLLPDQANVQWNSGLTALESTCEFPLNNFPNKPLSLVTLIDAKQMRMLGRPLPVVVAGSFWNNGVLLLEIQRGLLKRKVTASCDSKGYIAQAKIYVSFFWKGTPKGALINCRYLTNVTNDRVQEIILYYQEIMQLLISR